VTPDELDQLASRQAQPIPHAGEAVVVHAAAYVRHMFDGRDGRELARLLRLRSATGVSEYGTELQTRNGRSAAIDALQEASDLVMYTTQGVLEADQTNRLEWWALRAEAAKVARQALILARADLRRRARAARKGDPR